MPEPKEQRSGYRVASSQQLIVRSRKHLAESQLLTRNVEAQLRASRNLLRRGSRPARKSS